MTRTAEERMETFNKRKIALQRYINESAVPVIKEGEKKEEKAKQFFAKYDEEPKGFLAWLNHFLIWIMNPVGKLRNVAYAAEAVNVLSDLIAVVEKSSQTNAQASSSSSQAPPPVLSEKTQTTLNALFVEKRKKLGYRSTVRNESILLEKEVASFKASLVSIPRDVPSTKPQPEEKPSAAPTKAPVDTRSSAFPLPEERSASPTATESATQETRGATSSTGTSSRRETGSEKRSRNLPSDTRELKSDATDPVVREWSKKYKNRIEFLTQARQSDEPTTAEKLKKQCLDDLKKLDELFEATGTFIEEKKKEGSLSREVMKQLLSKLRSVSKALQRKYHSDRHLNINTTALSQVVNDDPLCKGFVLEELMALRAGKKTQAALSEETKAYLASHSLNNTSGEEADENDFFEKWEAQYQDQKQEREEEWTEFISAYRANIRKMEDGLVQLDETVGQAKEAACRAEAAASQASESAARAEAAASEASAAASEASTAASEASTAASEASTAASEAKADVAQLRLEIEQRFTAAEQRLEKLWGKARVERKAQEAIQEIEEIKKRVAATPPSSTSQEEQSPHSDSNMFFSQKAGGVSQEESEAAGTTPLYSNTSNKPGLQKQ